MKEEMFSHPGNLLHGVRGPRGKTGNFKGWREECGSWPAATQVRETSTDCPGRVAALPRQRPRAAGVCSSQVLKLRLHWTDPGKEDLVWLHEDSIKGLECGPGSSCGHMQDRAQVHHRSPIINMGKREHGSTIAAPLSDCSQWGMGPDSWVL